MAVAAAPAAEIQASTFMVLALVMATMLCLAVSWKQPTDFQVAVWRGSLEVEEARVRRVDFIKAVVLADVEAMVVLREENEVLEGLVEFSVDVLVSFGADEAVDA